jgi:hypothetical protein
MPTKTTLCAERGRLIDEQFLRGLSPAEAARLAEIDAELERRDAPKVRRLKQSMDRDFGVLARKIAVLEAKIAKNASDPAKAQSAHP